MLISAVMNAVVCGTYTDDASSAAYADVFMEVKDHSYCVGCIVWVGELGIAAMSVMMLECKVAYGTIKWVGAEFVPATACLGVDVSILAIGVWELLGALR